MMVNFEHVRSGLTKRPQQGFKGARSIVDHGFDFYDAPIMAEPPVYYPRQYIDINVAA